MILKGDCIKVMKAIKPNSVDAVVCDPPYGLEFMNKDWDKLAGDFGDTDKELQIDDGRLGSDGIYRTKTRPFSQHTKTPRYHAGLAMQLWHTQWLTEAYRVLKPGGSMLVMGGTRTSHRLACAIEDSGFIIKDTLMWIYGSGFPKAQDLGKMIDKRYKKKPEYYELAEFIKKARVKLGKSMNDIAILFPSKTGGITDCAWNWENARNVPTMEQWQILKKELGLSDKFDWLIEQETKRWEEVEREKIGKANWTAPKENFPAIPTKDNTKRMRLDITAPSTDLAKHWDGFKVGGIKPAYEPIIWAVKPPEGSYVDNVLKWNVGAVNVDECRIVTSEDCGRPSGTMPHPMDWGKEEKLKFKLGNSKGRFPANVILSHHPECVQMRMKKVKNNSGSVSGLEPSKPAKNVYGEYGRHTFKKHADSNNLEQVESWDCHPDCAVRMLDKQSGILKSGGGVKVGNRIIRNTPFTASRNYDDVNFNANSGGASRFFYCAKSSRGERNAMIKMLFWLDGKQIEKELHDKLKVENEINKNNNNFIPHKIQQGNIHPTVKAIKLFEWLIKLVTREGQIILDPFIGSGTTAIAAHNTGRKCVGIEKEEEYLEIAKRRIDYWKNQPKQMEMGL